MSAMPIILAIILLIFAPLNTITLTSAEVTELNVTPEVVVQGETLSVSGKALANEEVWIGSSFAIALPVSDGKYYDEFIGIDFPVGEKNFSVIAKNIKNITVSLSPVEGETVTITCSGQNMTIACYGAEIKYLLDESIDERGVVEFSVSLPKLFSPPFDFLPPLDIIGKKDIKISGDAADNATSVNLIVAMSIKVTADSEDDFTLDIDTEGVPPGEFLITAGGIEKTVEVVLTEPTPTPTPTPSSNGGDGSGDGDGDGTPDTTPTPSPTPTPTSTPTTTLAPTATPVAASPTVTPASPAPTTVTPSPSPQSKTNQSPRETPKPFLIPGFDLIGCIAALIIIVTLKKRRKLRFN